MEFKANIDYKSKPHAIIKFIEEKKDIYPYLSKSTQRRINRDYNLTAEIPVSKRALKECFPQDWQRYQVIYKNLQELPRPFLFQNSK